MSDLTKHTLTINISDRIDLIDKRCGLTEIQKDYVTAQMKEAVNNAVQEANEANKQPDKALPLHGVIPCLYKPDFIKWRDKYFKEVNKFFEYSRINKNEYFTKEQLHKRYEKAMIESPFK